MALINGTSFGLFHNGNLLGHSTQSRFSLNVDLPDATSKDSLGFKEVIAGIRSGSISVAGLVDYSDTINFDQLASMVLTKEVNEWVFTQEAFEGITLTGKGYINNVEQVGDMENLVSYDLEITLINPFTVQDDSGDRYWNTADILWNNANFEWNNA
jgi:predicted secreted protein